MNPRRVTVKGLRIYFPQDWTAVQVVGFLNPRFYGWTLKWAYVADYLRWVATKLKSWHC